MTKPKLPVPHPDFADYPRNQQLEVLADVMAKKKDTPLEQAVSKAGISEELYVELIQDRDYGQKLIESAEREVIIPAAPQVFAKLAEGAEGGDPAKIRMYLEMIKMIKPEGINLEANLLNLSTDQIRIRIEQLNREASE